MLVRNTNKSDNYQTWVSNIVDLRDTNFVLFLGENKNSVESDLADSNLTLLSTKNYKDIVLSLEDGELVPSAIIIEECATESIILFHYINRLRMFKSMANVPVIIYSEHFDAKTKSLALKYNLDDYHYNSSNCRLATRIDFLNKINSNSDDSESEQEENVKNTQWVKRAFDVFFSLTALILLSPLLAIISIAVYLESGGPIFYISKRAGSAYKIFDFIKFRTMVVDAEDKLEEMSGYNQYEKGSGDATFFKLKNDPRVTEVGKILRKTSLDELPQLINVLKGDMSIVGNRPLPLYEAQKLTSDTIALRFLAPAGITGLWQVTKRGKEEMSEMERIKLDMVYARKNSFWYDIKIMFMTIPALMQHDSV